MSVVAPGRGCRRAAAGTIRSAVDASIAMTSDVAITIKSRSFADVRSIDRDPLPPCAMLIASFLLAANRERHDDGPRRSKRRAYGPPLNPDASHWGTLRQADCERPTSGPITITGATH
ncbi:MAG: hypothetical protein INR70_28600 [Parafilimonas terrae]|nr:hypothetical protein [Parafilimonas terrae]